MATLIRFFVSPAAQEEGASDRRDGLLSLALLILTLCLLGALYLRSTTTLIEINDEAGYLYGGSQIAATGAPAYWNAYNQSVGPYFTLSAFRVQRPGDPRFYLIYPLGYPLLIALTQVTLAGWAHAMFYVTPVFALLAGLAAFLLGCTLRVSKRSFAPYLGLWAAVLVLADPILVRNGTRAFSDVPALACMLLGYALLFAPRRASGWRGIAAGVFFGYACLTRQISAITLIGVVLWVFLNRRDWRQHRPTWLGLALSLGLFGILVLGYNAVVFGGPLTTGYALQHHWIPFPAFSWQNFLGHSPIRSGGYRVALDTVFADLGIAGLLAAAIGAFTLPRRASIALGVTALVVIVAQAFYAWPASDGGGRFLLPALAILRLYAAAGLAWALARVRLRREVALILGLAIIIVLQRPAAAAAFTEAAQRTQGAADRVSYVRAVAAQTAPESVFISWLYGDHFIVYGDRAALLLALVTPSEPGRYLDEEFAPLLSAVVRELQARQIPVYVIADGAGGTRTGFADPLPVLQAGFHLTPCFGREPAIFRVWPAAAPGGC